MSSSYPAPRLTAFAAALLHRGGLESEKASVVAEILVEADLLGHTTHGLQLLPLYLEELAHDRMAKSGAPRALADLPAAVTWDGMNLPGPWLVVQALALAIERAKINGTCAVVIRRSHHIACLAAYLQRVTEQGFMVMLTCSDPRMGAVAPHGGRRGVFTPNPIAAAWPADGEPVIIDTSMSIASYGVARRFHQDKRRLPGPWLIDAQGRPSADPAVLFADPPGALLPIGGLDHGYKGYALGLLVEALTSGLAGHGRADAPTSWTSNVFLEVLDPALFGGLPEFRRQTAWIADACRRTPPRPGFDRVRLPGEAGLHRRASQIANGVELHPGILPALEPWAARFGVPSPSAA
ncbi:MAG TPA: Ldh family oxidoreductase [Opitutaceae bacterium]|nr:Ldh family oxidoreductase [Opitutaceae bacterium]